VNRPTPERGDLVYLNFNPQSGHEQSGRRPGIVLSPHAFNLVTGFAVVCPITSQEKGYPFEVKLPDGLHIKGGILKLKIKFRKK
jgi:mRNA interferase MazF